MQDKNGYQVQTVPALTAPKRLGSYLVDAGLLTADQIKVILNDQQATGMRFGEIVAARGWVKEQTIEWIVTKVVEPERTYSRKQSAPQSNPQSASQSASRPQSLQVLRAAASESREAGTAHGTAHSAGRTGASTSGAGKSSSFRRELPISKPLPPVKSPDGDVNWVG